MACTSNQAGASSVASGVLGHMKSMGCRAGFAYPSDVCQQLPKRVQQVPPQHVQLAVLIQCMQPLQCLRAS